MQVSEYVANLEMPKESLSMMDFIMDIEDEFNIIINDAEMAEITSKEYLISMIERKVNEQTI